MGKILQQQKFLYVLHEAFPSAVTEHTTYVNGI